MTSERLLGCAGLLSRPKGDMGERFDKAGGQLTRNTCQSSMSLPAAGGTVADEQHICHFQVSTLAQPHCDRDNACLPSVGASVPFIVRPLVFELVPRNVLKLPPSLAYMSLDVFCCCFGDFVYSRAFYVGVPPGARRLHGPVLQALPTSHGLICAS